MRLIDAEALEEDFYDNYDKKGYRNGKSLIYAAWCLLKKLIEKAPTIEAKPVVHAHWVDVNPNLHIGMKCSLCGARIKYSEFFNGNHRYCHKCGAQMDEEVEE